MKQGGLNLCKLSCIIILQGKLQLTICQSIQYRRNLIDVIDIFFQTIYCLLNRICKFPDLIFRCDIKSHIQIAFCQFLCHIIQSNDRLSQLGCQMTDRDDDNDNTCNDKQQYNDDTTDQTCKIFTCR